MLCKCGYALPDNAKFCPECGQAAPEPEPMPEPEKKQTFLTVAEMMEELKISRSKMYSMIRNNEIPWFPIGSDKRFILEDVKNHMRNQYSEKFKEKFLEKVS